MVGVLMIVGFRGVFDTDGTSRRDRNGHRDGVGVFCREADRARSPGLLWSACWSCCLTTFGQLWPAFLVTLVGAAACPAVTGALAAFFSLCGAKAAHSRFSPLRSAWSAVLWR